MFKTLFGGGSSPQKIDDAVTYFFRFSLHILDQEGDGPVNLSESDRFDFRARYIAESGAEDHGVMFFAKIECESTSFTNHHLQQRTVSQIGECCDPIVVHGHPIVEEVRRHLSRTI
jgi:hypothetical protein